MDELGNKALWSFFLSGFLWSTFVRADLKTYIFKAVFLSLNLYRGKYIESTQSERLSGILILKACLNYWETHFFIYCKFPETNTLTATSRLTGHRLN